MSTSEFLRECGFWERFSINLRANWVASEFPTSVHAEKVSHEAWKGPISVPVGFVRVVTVTSRLLAA